MKKIIPAILLCAGLSIQSVSATGLGACTHMGLGYTYGNSLNIKSAKEVRLDWIRDECRWDYMQDGNNGEIKIRDKDLDYMKLVDESGINQLLILAYGNDSFSGVEKNTGFPTIDNIDYYNGFLNYVRYTVGEVGKYVDAYELWNEPNLEGFNPNGTPADYARLYLDTKAIINELDPGARVLCGCITGAGDEPFAYANGIFDYIASVGNVNKLIDVFSIHLYTQGSESNYSKSLDNWEKVFDSYGFAGDVWMTENGVSAGDGTGETKQALFATKMAMLWENYLKSNGRNGINFWYDLRNDVGISDSEDNFGLVDANHNIKPAGKAVQTYNKLLGDAGINGVAQIKTKDNWFTSDEYGYLATYSAFGNKIYLAYDSNGNDKSTSVELSGDMAYVYDYLGNLTETITSPSGSKSITLKNEPTYIVDMTYQTSVTNTEYDDVQGILTVNGKTNAGDMVTMEILKDGEVVRTAQTKAEGVNYSGWVSVLDGGEYTVRVGKPELEALGKTSGWAEYKLTVVGARESATELSAGATYNREERKVNLNITIESPQDEQYVTVLVIPETMDVANIDMNGVGYIRQAKVENGSLSAEFILPEYFTTNAKIYLGGTGIGTATSEEVDIAESEYLYVASLDITKGDSITASAICRNYNETERSAEIMVAQYDGDGRLVAVDTNTIKIPARSYAALEGKLSDVVIDSSAVNAKAFIWDEIGGIKPLAVFDSVSLK